MGKTDVILVFGGKSTEHEVSIRSAKSVYDALDKNRYNVIPVGITKKGAWIGGEMALKSLMTGSSLLSGKSNNIMLPDPTSRYLQKQDKPDLAGSRPVQVVFPVLHGLYGEDGTIQGLFELANIAYVGCGVLSSALGMDKVKQKEIMRLNKIPVVKYIYFYQKNWSHDAKDVISKTDKYFKREYPLFVKPANSGSSVGITKVHNAGELEEGLAEAFLYDWKVLIEKGMEGKSEIETSVLGNDNPEVSVCGEVVPEEEFYSYEAKYILDNTKLLIPADISKELSDKIRNIARQAYIAIEGAGMARADFFADKKTNQVWLNELNTIPGFTSISMYPKLWEYSGLPYNKLVDKLIELALEKWQEKQKLKTTKG
jgi:D-alanine-D-alanine ligase